MLILSWLSHSDPLLDDGGQVVSSTSAGRLLQNVGAKMQTIGPCLKIIWTGDDLALKSGEVGSAC